MAAQAGRIVRVQHKTSAAASYVDVGGARTDGITFNTEYIDITDKDDDGIQTYLDDIGRKAVEMSCEGVLTTDRYMTLAATQASGSALHLMKFNIPGIGSLEGSFALPSYEVSGADGAEAATFSMTAASSGVIAYTAT